MYLQYRCECTYVCTYFSEFSKKNPQTLTYSWQYRTVLTVKKVQKDQEIKNFEDKLILVLSIPYTCTVNIILKSNRFDQFIFEKYFCGKLLKKYIYLYEVKEIF